MEKENEIVVYDNESQIVDYNFARIDMNQPATILSFGSDVKDQISAILDSAAQMAIGTEEVHVDDKMIANITSFEESLDERICDFRGASRNRHIGGFDYANTKRTQNE